MATTNNFLSTMEHFYFSYSQEKFASKRIQCMEDYLLENPIFNHALDSSEEKIKISLFLCRLLKEDDLFVVAKRFSLLKNSCSFLLSKKIICPCFAAYLKEFCKQLDLLILYHFQERMISLITNYDLNSFENLFQIEHFIFDTSRIPYDLLLGSVVYQNFFYQKLSNNQPFLLYDFMNQTAFEERDRMQQKWNQLGNKNYEEKITMLKRILEDISNFDSNEFLNLFLYLNDLLLKKASKKRIRKNPNSSYDYYESLV